MHDYQYQPPETWDEEYDYTSDISIDPDNILDKNWKSKFKDLCSEFRDIITPRPNRYNGFYGRVDNSLQFGTQPPPMTKPYLPKYSNEMMKTLAQKMDELESWNVLAKPEDLGITPVFCSPSMLVKRD